MFKNYLLYVDFRLYYAVFQYELWIFIYQVIINVHCHTTNTPCYTQSTCRQLASSQSQNMQHTQTHHCVMRPSNTIADTGSKSSFIAKLHIPSALSLFSPSQFFPHVFESVIKNALGNQRVTSTAPRNINTVTPLRSFLSVNICSPIIINIDA